MAASCECDSLPFSAQQQIVRSARQVSMDDYEFDANLDRLGYELDCARLNALRARFHCQALGSAPRTGAGHIAAARNRCRQLEQRFHALQRTVAELGAGRARSTGLGNATP
jgi:hypothetical protein